MRHGETEWSAAGRHTSYTDLELTAAGELAALDLGARLPHHFDLVLTSPRRRARRTAELAGFPDAVIDQDLVEWDYGDYEGITTPQIRERDPGWTVWTHACPGGAGPQEVTARCDRVIGRLAEVGGKVLVFGHGHSLRSLTARWLGQDVDEGRFFRLDTATLSVLGHERETPVILRWNA